MGSVVKSDYGYAMVCPPGDRHRFDDAVAASPSLRELIERGGTAVRSFPSLLNDVFCFFYMPDPALRPETADAGRLNRLVIEYLMGSTAFAAIRRKTVLDFDAAVAAAERFGQMFADYLHSGTLGSSAPPGAPTDQQLAPRERRLA